MRERSLGTPPGTVPRRDDTRLDTIGEAVDGRLDPRLHALACQMVAAEDDVDRLAPERAQRAERCVHDAGVRARREHTDAAAAHARREEALVEEQGSGTGCPSRTVWCPTNPASYDVTRSIAPLTKKKPARTCASACFVTRPPALSIASHVGSGFNSTSVPAGGMMPRWSGRSGWRSTIGGGSPSSRRDRVMAATTPGSPPLWSACQCE